MPGDLEGGVSQSIFFPLCESEEMLSLHEIRGIKNVIYSLTVMLNIAK